MRNKKKFGWIALGILALFGANPCWATQHSFREISNEAPKNPIYKYFLGDYFTPLKHFMPKNRKDWTMDYLYAHPKSEAIVWYFMEKAFYKGGMLAARDFLQALYHYGQKKHNVEMEFDVYLAQHLFDGSNLPIGFWSIHFPPSEINGCLKVASVSQAYCAQGYSFFQGDLAGYRFLANLHCSDSYILEVMASCCVSDNFNLKYRPQRSKEEIRVLTEARGINLLEQSIRIDPNNVSAIADIVPDLTSVHQFALALKYAIEGKKSFLRQNLPKASSMWQEFNSSISYCKQELGQK